MMKKHFSLLILLLFTHLSQAQTYASRLGFPADAKVVILHVDDAGMSFDSNLGAIRAMEEGVATSVSVMMPCPWVPGFVRYLKENPNADAGLHLTLTPSCYKTIFSLLILARTPGSYQSA